MSSPVVTTLRSRTIATAPATLSLVENSPGERLHLLAAGAREWGRVRRFANTVLSRAQPRDPAPMILDSLLCNEAKELHLRGLWRLFGPNLDETISGAEISSLRLRVVERDHKVLTLNLTVATKDDRPATSAVFSMDELDRDDEALDLGMQLARCLGLRGYRIRHQAPADIELVPNPDTTTAYRSSPIYLPVPASSEKIDYRLPPGNDQREPADQHELLEDSKTPLTQHGLLNDGWTIEQWHPGQRIELCKPGKSQTQALLWTVLLRIPVGLLIAITVAGLYLGGLMLLAGLALFLPVGLFCLAIGTDPPMWLAYTLGVWGAGSSVFSLYCGAVAGLGVGRWWHQEGLARTWLLDWEGDTVVEGWGGREQTVASLQEFETVAVRTYDALANVDAQGAIPLILEGAGEDLELFQWVAPSESELLRIKSMVAALALALGASNSNAP